MQPCDRFGSRAGVPIALAAENRVLGDVPIEDQRFVLAILRDDLNAARDARARSERCGKILVAKPDRPLVGRHARESVGKCSLPVTFDACNSENLAGLNRKLEPFDRIRFGSRAQSTDEYDR